MAILMGGGSDANEFEGTRTAGTAGILAAVALAGEFLFFSLAGFQQVSVDDPAAALTFLGRQGGLVRVAVLFGATGVALTLVFLYGLAVRLRAGAPSFSLATLIFGIVGNVGDGLVALSFWLGIPILVRLSVHQPASAQSAWPAFTAITTGFQGFGNLFLGLSLLAAGIAVLRARALSRGLGAIAIAAGLLSVAGVLIPDAQVGFLLAIVLVIAFRLWAGVALYRIPRSTTNGPLAAAAVGGTQAA